jgi:hypothetical protein
MLAYCAYKKFVHIVVEAVVEAGWQTQEPWDFAMIDEGPSTLSTVFLIGCLWIFNKSRFRAGAKPFL